MSGFTVSRRAAIAAPPATVRAYVADFRRWRDWSPWEDLDPNLTRTYSGSDSGIGAQYSWKGNRKAGTGAMEIIGETPESLRIELRFLKPWRASNEVVFTFAPDDGGTLVTWTMSGTHTGLARLFARFMSFDKLIGRDFEKGLASLRKAAEGR
jgi:hypothetical protein